MPVDDYYSLIGVSPDADRDTIRDAYRARRSELDDSEQGRSSAARLNRAWNVLSDAAQRARYDDELATAKADDDVIVPELVGATRASSNGKGNTSPRATARTRGGRQRPERPVRQPIAQEIEVNGVPLASNRDRAFAVATDAILCILLLVVGVQFVAQKLAEGKTDSSVPVVVKTLPVKVPAGEKPCYTNVKVNRVITDYLDEIQKSLDKCDQKNIDKYIKLRDDAKTKAQSAAYDKKKKAWEKAFDDDTKEQTKVQHTLDGVGRVTLFGAGVITFLLFAVPSALTGRTLGKALRKIRLMKEDAVTPAGWRTSVVRYGAVIGFIVVAGVFLGQYAQLAWIVAIFGVTSFSRNAKRQGWHDRIAHTVVIAG